MTNPYRNLSDWKEVWAGIPALVIGRGETRLSVDAQAFQATGGKVFVVNEMINLPEYAGADVVCMQDRRAPRRTTEALGKYNGVFWGRENLAKDKMLDQGIIDKMSWMDPEYSGVVFDPELDRVYLTKGTVHYAFCMAYWAGCSPIYLAGIDMRVAKGRRLHADTLQDDMAEEINKFHYMMAMSMQHEFWNKVIDWQRNNNWKTRPIYKTSNYSMLPFEIRLPE